MCVLDGISDNIVKTPLHGERFYPSDKFFFVVEVDIESSSLPRGDDFLGEEANIVGDGMFFAFTFGEGEVAFDHAFHVFDVVCDGFYGSGRKVLMDHGRFESDSGEGSA